jgi:ubiquinone/menaquinone biosynthesis C-methylase UbiE
MRWASTLPDAARSYQEYMVPGMFVPLAERMIELAEVAEGDRVLDVACGTGSLTRLLAAQVGTRGRVAAVDLSPQMVAVARELGAHGGATIEYQEAPADALPFADAEFTLLTCQQGLQFFPDRPAALAEFLRVLAPGGRAAVATWTDGGVGFNAIIDALRRHIGDDIAAMIAAPYVINDPGELRALFEAAGFSDIVVEVERVVVRFPDPPRYGERIIGSGPAAARFAQASEQQRKRVIADVAAAMEHVRDGDMAVFEMPTLVALARV